jgi:hypothetical protein
MVMIVKVYLQSYSSTSMLSLNVCDVYKEQPISPPLKHMHFLAAYRFTLLSSKAH